MRMHGPFSFEHIHCPLCMLMVSHCMDQWIQEAYTVTRQKYRALPRDQLQGRAILHDGRLARRPTATNALLTFLWMPLGFALALVRAHLHLLLPVRALAYAYKLTGVKLVVRGNRPPPSKKKKGDQLGVLFVCNHRSTLDAVAVGVALGRKVRWVVTDGGAGASRFSEPVVSPIMTGVPLPVPTSLEGDADADAAPRIRRLLEEGDDVVVFPEGAICREPFLLRFGALFAEVTDRIVPVAIEPRESMFHGSTARGLRGMDPYFFFMNPRPTYEVTFLNQLPGELTCGGGRSPVEVASYVQEVLAAQLGFECT
jgi:glycerol-3-phosphate acyltransferase